MHTVKAHSVVSAAVGCSLLLRCCTSYCASAFTFGANARFIYQLHTSNTEYTALKHFCEPSCKEHVCVLLMLPTELLSECALQNKHTGLAASAAMLRLQATNPEAAVASTAESTLYFLQSSLILVLLVLLSSHSVSLVLYNALPK
jgi:hypothetical protein